LDARNTTGASRIRAGIPPDWQAADKTGTGDYCSANDIAILWLPGRAPLGWRFTPHGDRRTRGRATTLSRKRRALRSTG
jgi:beta-lactamase class A